MFCQTCGSSHNESAKFCETCGAAFLQSHNTKSLSNSNILQSTCAGPASCSNGKQPLSFQDYMESRRISQSQDVTFTSIQKRKTNERVSEGTKKKAKKDEIVKINIGIAEIDGDGRQLKTKRRSHLPIDVKKTDSHVTVKNLGIEKQFAHNKQLRECGDCEWILLYPDFDLVLLIPGTEEPFSVGKYKESIGRPFSRVNLYLCTMSDYEVANNLEDNTEKTVTNSDSKQIQPVAEDVFQVKNGADEFAHSSDPFALDAPDSLLAAIDFPSIDLTTTIEQPDVFEVQNEMPDTVMVGDYECEGNVLVQAEGSQHEITFDHMELIVHRSTLLKDLISAFCDPKVLTSTLFVKVVNTNGMEEEGEGRGVVRDVLTEFWHLFFQSLAIGAAAKVPVIRHDYQKQQWKAIARIILYGYCREGIFPIALSAVFIASCILGEDNIPDEMLLKAFTMYVSDDEREVINGCLENRANVVENSELLELLSSYKCLRNPSEENILDILCQLAHQELIQRPRYVANCWSPILQSLKALSPFQNTTNILAFYEDKRPTPKKVIKMLDASPENDAQRISLDHLTKFIKSLGGNVVAFLQFTTGASVILDGQKLKVCFTELSGFARRPVAHTCGPMLEVPSTYQCYNELVEEFSSILREKSAWTFNIV